MFKKKYLILAMILSIIMGLTFTPALQAQNWQAIPPYNILWPLFSPTLSPSVGGVPTPLLTSLTSDTILPMQPILGWNPNSF